MKKIQYVLIVGFLLSSRLLLANSDAKPVEGNKAMNNWKSSPDGVKFTNWEASPTGQKVHAGAIKINRAIRGNASLTGVVTSLSLPEGSKLGFGIMVSIQGDDYILTFGGESDREFDSLRKLRVNDRIIIKSHHVSKAPKYAYPILAPTFVIQNHKFLFKRAINQGGC